ncbi:hypothetical protein Ddye_012113 [Dipteronia dyeriana]|uniref:Ubiquitin-like protease family profile domain-containing protein n=1 Tax=Dipteronia dyeriana TaxID=168575 RepID=A0AAE0CI83_9ROSI|nr:hypothetical protein Ddye_012113 [Dipteronia dyeriana]
MEMDGAQMDEKDEQMDEKEELELVGSNGEEKGVQVDFEAQVHLDDRTDDEASVPVEKHVDFALYWIRKVKFESPTAKMEMCTTMDILFQQHLDARFQRFTKQEGLWFENDKLFEYATGAAPRLVNPWIGVDKVYTPLNYESGHWILAEINMIAQKIMVYDYDTNLIGNRKFNKFMKPLSNMLPLLLQKVKYFDRRPGIEHGGDMTHWCVERCQLVPQ